MKVAKICESDFKKATFGRRDVCLRSRMVLITIQIVRGLAELEETKEAKVKVKVNFEMYIADRKANTCI